jgi:hypothetical protein
MTAGTPYFHFPMKANPRLFGLSAFSSPTEVDGTLPTPVHQYDASSVPTLKAMAINSTAFAARYWQVKKRQPGPFI